MTKTKQKSILVVDDDQQFRNFMVDLLSDYNFNVSTADNGAIGLDKLFVNKPDLLITDIVMPEKEGVELILTTKKLNASLPIVAVSGGNMGNADSYLKMAKKLGADAVLSKPFSHAEIVDVINELLTD